jgi:regulator of protease activity HflC (stomatin/prohibitin superfamily)
MYTYGWKDSFRYRNLSATTLRNIIGEMELDHTLTFGNHQQQNRIILDEATDPWGIKVNRWNSRTLCLPPKFRMPWKSK